MKKNIPEHTFIVILCMTIVFFSVLMMVYHQEKSRNKDAILKSVIQESIKEGVNADSLKLKINKR